MGEGRKQTTHHKETKLQPTTENGVFQLAELNPSSTYSSVFCGPTEESVPFKKPQKIHSNPLPAKVH